MIEHHKKQKSESIKKNFETEQKNKQKEFMKKNYHHDKKVHH